MNLITSDLEVYKENVSNKICKWNTMLLFGSYVNNLLIILAFILLSCEDITCNVSSHIIPVRPGHKITYYLSLWFT